jgi:hypothetical protein
MDILHTNEPCDFCGRSSRFGWLYLCQQDVHRQSNTREQLGQIKALVLTDNMALEEELEAIGISESVIQQFKRGVYTPEQLDKLMEQKLNLQKVIAAQLELEREPWNTHTASPSQSDRQRRISIDESIPPNLTVRTAARKESLSVMYKTGNVRRKSPSMSRCCAKACQVCEWDRVCALVEHLLTVPSRYAALTSKTVHTCPSAPLLLMTSDFSRPTDSSPSTAPPSCAILASVHQ